MSISKLPTEINVMDEKYKVVYCDDASDVCVLRRHNKIKEIDFWKNEIRIFKGPSTEFEIWNRIWDSLLLIFVEKFHISKIVEDDIQERHLLLFSMGIGDILINNEIINDRIEFPKSVMVFNSLYNVKYYDKASQVDHIKRESLWGQIDSWDSIIRVYEGQVNKGSIWQTIWHELIHAILGKVYLKLNDNEDFVDLMATAINGIFEHNEEFRNRFKK